MKPTAEQLLIIQRGKETNDNLLIVARAGAAKTTTLEMLANELPSTRILMLAFNKKIAEEMKARMPQNCVCKTLNSVGHGAWKDFLGKWPTLEANKMTGLLRAAIERHSAGDQTLRDFLYDIYTDLRDALREAKQQGYLPERIHGSVRPLIEDESFFSLLEFEAGEVERQIINECVLESFRMGIKGVIDFDDQIYLPAIMPCSFEKFPLVMIDEAQDLSPINHVLLFKIVRGQRIIAVGDPCQAIYGFRGASEKSMDELRQMFSMDELYLTICFRSAQTIVENARWRAPDMQWAPWAKPGLVQTLEEWGPELLEDGDAIICRNNAPLFRMAIALIRARLHPELASGDVMKGLLAIMKKLGPRTMPPSSSEVELERWKNDQLARTKNPAKIVDQAECIQVFLDETESLGAAMDYLEEVAQRAGKIKLMTGHKSKGLEFTRVWFLDRFLLKPKGQDLNLRYVIETRAKMELRYVRSEDWGRLQSTNDLDIESVMDTLDQETFDDRIG